MNNTAPPFTLPSQQWTLHADRLFASAVSFGSLLAADLFSLPWTHCVAIWTLSLLLWACIEVRAGERAGSPTAADSASFAATAALFAVSFFAMAWLSQPMTWLNGGMAWDGQSYFTMYGAFKGYPHSDIPAPYGQRVGLPLLATFLHFHADVNFGIFECGFWVGAAALMAHCLRAQFRLSAPATLAVFAWAHLMFISPARSAHFAPFNVEAPAIFFFVLFLWLANTRKLTPSGTICLAAFAGFSAAFFKETALLVAVLGFASHCWIAGRARRALAAKERDSQPRFHRWARAVCEAALAPATRPWLGLALGAVAGCLIAQIPFGFGLGAARPTNLSFWILRRFEHPAEFVRIAAAYALAWAPFAMLAVASLAQRLRAAPRKPDRALRAGEAEAWALLKDENAAARVNDRALWLLLGLYALVSSFSGSDLTRFAFFALPLAAPLIVRRAGDWHPLLWLAALAMSAPLGRLLDVIPSPDVTVDPFNRGKDATGLYSWFAEYAVIHQVVLLFAFVAACGLLLALAQSLSTKLIRK